MSLSKRLSSPKYPIFVQHLLYPEQPHRHRNSNPPSYAATQKYDPNPIPTPELIDDLFRISQSVLDKLGRAKPSTEYNTELPIQRNASWWSGNIAVFQMDYSKQEYGVRPMDIMKHGDHKHLYGEMFQYLAEAIFHVYKIVRSVRDAVNFKTSSESTLWAWRRIQQDDALYGEIHRGIALVRTHANLFDFCFQGYDQWLEHKSEEDYSILFYDNHKLYMAMVFAIRSDSNRWGSKMVDMSGKFAAVRLQSLHPTRNPKDETLPAYRESQGSEARRRHC